MKESKVTPRVLADDLLINTYGPGHRARIVKTVEQSIKYFEDIGAKVAENKCFTFASDALTRNYLKNFKWRHSNKKIPNKTNFRDLGAHVNMTKTRNGATLTKRMQAAIGMCNRLKWLKLSNQNKNKIITSNIIPAALYGVETTHVSKNVMAGLRSAVAEVLGPKSSKRSLDILYNLSDKNKEIDPKAHVLLKRVMELRRMMCKDTDTQNIIKEMITSYNANEQALQIVQLQESVDNDDWINMSEWKKEMHHEWEECSKCITGPVMLLMHEIKEYGYDIDNDFNMRKANEPTINLWQMPCQHLKTAIHDIIRQQRDREASKNRTFLDEYGEMDHEMAKELINGVGLKEQHIYRHVATGGMWNSREIEQISDQDNTCKHCGEVVSDSIHVLWNCCAINKHRVHKDLAEMSTEGIPKAILYGIPLSMGWQLTKPFWHKHGDSHHNASKVGTLKNKIESGREYEIKEMLIQNNIDEKCNARQAIMQLKHGEDEGELTSLPYKCSRQPPTEPNVYSDGSWIIPTKRFLSLGGAGIWWPGRTINKNDANDGMYYMPLSDGEVEIGDWKQEPLGLSLYTKIGGYSGSSTRTELAAGIMAMAAHGPVNLASDSQAFVKAANALILKMGKNKDHRIKWKMHNDGDLWEHFHDSLKSKSPEAVKIKWTKGHAKQIHVDKGITTIKNKNGNDKADENADEGTRLHHKTLIEATKWLANRHQAYTKFMKKVVTHITEAYIIHKQLDDIAEEEEEKGDKRMHYKKLTYPSDNETTKLATKFHLGHYGGFMQNDQTAKHLHSFLENIKIQKIENGSRAITWLELYILYRIRGYKKPIDDPRDASHTRATLDKQMNTFKNKLRAVVSRIYYCDQQQEVFSPAKIKNDNLIGIGITGRHQGPSFNVSITEEEAREIAGNLHQLNHTLTKVKLDKILDGNLKFIPRVLVMRGKADWNHNIKTLSEPTLVDYEDWKKEILRKMNENRNKYKEVIMLQCSKCQKSDPHYALKPNLFEVEGCIKCRHCGKTSASKNWNCACGIKWFMCDQHRWCTQEGRKNDGSKQDEGKPKKVQKTQHAGTMMCENRLMVSHQQLLEEDLKIESEKFPHKRNAKAKSDITLDDPGVQLKRPRVLGPKLSAKFGVPGTHQAHGGTNKANQQHGEMVRTRSCENTLGPTKKPRVDGEFHQDETNKANQQKGELVRIRRCENNPNPTKKPRIDGVVHHYASGVQSTHAASSSSLL